MNIKSIKASNKHTIFLAFDFKVILKIVKYKGYKCKMSSKI